MAEELIFRQGISGLFQTLFQELTTHICKLYSEANYMEEVLRQLKDDIHDILDEMNDESFRQQEAQKETIKIKLENVMDRLDEVVTEATTLPPNRISRRTIMALLNALTIQSWSRRLWEREFNKVPDLKPGNILLLDEVKEPAARYSSLPQMLALGPRFRHEPHLKPLEQHKERALSQFLKLSGKPIDDQVKTRKTADAMGLLGGMILDGAFVLEVLRLSGLVESPTLATGYAPNDPIFSSHGVLYTLPFIRRDMLILENQIPLLVLQKMVAFQTRRFDEYEIRKEIATKLVNLLVPGIRVPSNIQGIHALDVVRSSLIGSHFRLGSRVVRITAENSYARLVASSTSLLRYITCLGQKGLPNDYDVERLKKQRWSLLKMNKIPAIQLWESGINLKQSMTTDLTDISFRRRILRLPTILIDDTTEVLLSNLMAFESQQHGCRGWQVSSYVYFMGSLIQSAEDVRLLRRNGILKSARGSDNEVAKLFCNLSKSIDLAPADYALAYTHLELLLHSGTRSSMRCSTVVCLAVLLLSVVQSIVLFARS